MAAAGPPIETAGSYRPDSSRHVLPTRRASRLDEPPETATLG